MDISDISVAIKTPHLPSDVLAQADVVLDDLFALNYLLFRHGSQLHRRLVECCRLLVHRTLLALCLMFAFIINSGFTFYIPVTSIVFIGAMSILAPIQTVLHTITFKDYGFDEYYRVYGEYKRNSTIRLLDRETVIKESFHALADFIIIWLVSLNPRAYISPDGRPASSGAFNIYFGLTLITVFTIKTLNSAVTIKFTTTLNFVILVLTLLVFFEDENLIGLTIFF